MICSSEKETRPDKAMSADKARPVFWELQRPRYLLSGLMKCGCCGANFTKYGANRFYTRLWPSPIATGSRRWPRSSTMRRTAAKLSSGFAQ